MSEKKKTCPWCQTVIDSPQENKLHSGRVILRRCGACGNILAAYAAEERNFLPQIRVFKNA
jgi:hypothetical protein